jgi:hypothetical protein
MAAVLAPLLSLVASMTGVLKREAKPSHRHDIQNLVSIQKQTRPTFLAFLSIKMPNSIQCFFKWTI